MQMRDIYERLDVIEKRLGTHASSDAVAAGLKGLHDRFDKIDATLQDHKRILNDNTRNRNVTPVPRLRAKCSTSSSNISAL